MMVVGKVPHKFHSKKGGRYPATSVIGGIALKISAIIKSQNVYLKFDRERAYAPRVPIVSEVITTKKQTKDVFIKAFQNSS